MKTAKSWLGTLSILASLALPAHSQSFLTNGLVAYYPFDGSAADASGNGYNGTNNAVTLATDRFGQPNAAYYFNGTNSAIYLPGPAFNNLAQGTISTWVEMDNNTNAALFVKQHDGLNTYGSLTVGYHLGLEGSPISAGPAGELYFHSANGVANAASLPVLTTGVWHQIAVTFSPTNCAIYVDGQISSSVSGNYSIPNDPNATFTAIGSLQGLPSLAGKMDDFRIYNLALSTNEIAQLYAIESQPPANLTNSLVAYYPFDGNTADASGNGYDGTNSAATLATDRFGQPDSAYYFNGTNSAIYLPGPAFNNLAQGTILTWVEMDNNTNDAIFVKQHDGQNTYGSLTVGYYLGLGGFPITAGPAGELYFHSANGVANAASLPVLTTGVWHQIGVTFSSTNCTIYIDGQISGSASGNYSIPNDPNATFTAIGSLEGQPSMAGKIDDFRIYSLALSADQIALLYAIESPSPTDLTNGLEAYYPFDGNAADATGNGYDGTNSAATLATDRFGQPNSAYYFNGTNSAIYLPGPAFNNLAQGTISTWVEMDNNTNDAIFVKQHDGQNTYGSLTVGYYLGLGGFPITAGPAGELYFHSANGVANAASLPGLTTGVWHQIAVTFSPTNCVIYVDGLISSSASGNYSIPDDPNATFTAIGSLEGQPSMAGKIDDFRIYSLALSANQIAQLYAFESLPAAGPSRAGTGTSTLMDGSIVSVSITDGGYGYTNPPLVRFIGGGGSGAGAFATISNGVVSGITITNGGSGYTNAPLVVIDPPFIPSPVLSIASMSSLTNPALGAAFQLNSSALAPYNNYQIQFLPALGGTWSNWSGGFFSPTAATNAQIIFITNGAGFFRLEQVP